MLLFLLAVVVWVVVFFVCLFDCFVLENVNIIKNGNSLDAIEPVDKSNFICHKTVDLSAAASTCSDIRACHRSGRLRLGGNTRQLTTTLSDAVGNILLVTVAISSHMFGVSVLVSLFTFLCC